MAPPVGLEPTTTRLTAECSTDWAMEEYIIFDYKIYYITQETVCQGFFQNFWKKFLASKFSK